MKNPVKETPKGQVHITRSGKYVAYYHRANEKHGLGCCSAIQHETVEGAVEELKEFEPQNSSEESF